MIKKGDLSLTEADPEIEWNSNTGYRATRKFRGLKQDILGLVPSMQQLGYSFRITPDDEGPMSECTLTAPDAQDGAAADGDLELTTVWTVAGNDLEKSIENKSEWTSLPDAERDDLRDFLNGTKKETEVSVSTTNGVAFRDLIKAGTTSYTLSQIVVQRTMTVSPGFYEAASMTNVNRIYTKASLTTAEGIPGTIVFSMLDGQYLKRTPTITQQPNGRFQIVNEWWHADTWSTLLYGSVL
jgi:hypothetical protein